jgi:hypothetical protein
MKKSQFGATQIASILKEFDNGKRAEEINREHGESTKRSKINIAELPADIYFIRIYDGKVWTSKRVIKN